MQKCRLALTVLFSMLVLSNRPCAGQQRSPVDTGAPQVMVSHSAGKWVREGRKNKVEFNESDFSVSVHAGPITWKMVPSSSDDMWVSGSADQFHLRLTDAGEIKITPYETGFKTGIRLILDQFRNTGERSLGPPVDLRVVLTMCLEGAASRSPESGKKSRCCLADYLSLSRAASRLACLS